jgi:hypothetical protein
MQLKASFVFGTTGNKTEAKQVFSYLLIRNSGFWITKVPPGQILSHPRKMIALLP